MKTTEKGIVVFFALLFLFPFVNATFNVTTDLSGSDTGNWMGTKQFQSMCYDYNHNMVYIGTVSGPGVYDPSTGVLTNLNDTDTGNWVAQNLVDSCVYSSYDDCIYMGFANGQFGYYNISANVTTNLTSVVSGWVSGNAIDALTIDRPNALIYIGAGGGKLGYYNISANASVDLSATDTGNWMAADDIYSISRDSTHNLTFIGMQAGKYGVYNLSDNVTTDLHYTDTGNWIGNSDFIAGLTFDSTNGKTYLGISSGKFGAYDPTTNVTTSLSATDTGNWFGTYSLYSPQYNLARDRVYIGMSDGKFGGYYETTNVTTDLSATDTGDWIGSTDILSTAYDSVDNTIYLGLKDGKFGMYDSNGGCQNLSANATLDQDATSPNTCFNITSDNVILDCAGHSITYSTDGFWGYGVNNTGYDNVTIQNCEIIEGNGATISGHGINFINSVNNTIKDNNITTLGSGFGIYAEGTETTNVTNNTISTLGLGAYGINLASNSYYNVLSLNNITTGDDYAYGVYLSTNSDNNNVTLNNITTISDYGHGVVSEACLGSIINLNTIFIGDDAANGVSLLSGYNNLVESNNITTNNDASHGVEDLNENTSIYSNNILTYGISSFGIFGAGHDTDVAFNTVLTSGSGSHGILMYLNSSANITQNVVSTSGATATGIYLDEFANSNVTFNNVTTIETASPGIEIHINADNNTVSSNIVITSNDGSDGMYFDTSRNATVDNNTITTSGTGDANAIHLYETNDSIFSNNVVDAAQTFGYYSEVNSTNNVVTNLTMWPNSISFESLDIAINSTDYSYLPDPGTEENIGRYFYIIQTTLSSPSFIVLNVSYLDSDIIGIYENTLDIAEWDTGLGDWQFTGTPYGVNETENYVWTTLTTELLTYTEFGVFGEPYYVSPTYCWLGANPAAFNWPDAEIYGSNEVFIPAPSQDIVYRVDSTTVPFSDSYSLSINDWFGMSNQDALTVNSIVFGWHFIAPATDRPSGTGVVRQSLYYYSDFSDGYLNTHHMASPIMPYLTDGFGNNLTGMALFLTNWGLGIPDSEQHWIGAQAAPAIRPTIYLGATEDRPYTPGGGSYNCSNSTAGQFLNTSAAGILNIGNQLPLIGTVIALAVLMAAVVLGFSGGLMGKRSV